MSDRKRVAVLLSTYNGEKYVEQQIDSIMQQDYNDIELYIRDDNSRDSTREILQKLDNNSDSIHFINKSNITNLGVTGSFFNLLMNVDADYYMFCDQDDVWMENKVSKTLDRMLHVEKPTIPTLVHTNLLLVNNDLKVIGDHIWGTHPSVDIRDLIFTNNAAGCTMMINNVMKEEIKKDLDLVSDMFMHDWWIVLIASGFGINEFMEDSTMYYRQHQGNVVGGMDGVTARIHRISQIKVEVKRSSKILKQINAFYSRHKDDLSLKDAEYLKQYTKVVSDKSTWTNLRVLITASPRKSSIGGKIMLAFFMICLPKKLIESANQQ